VYAESHIIIHVEKTKYFHSLRSILNSFNNSDIGAIMVHTKNLKSLLKKMGNSIKVSPKRAV